MIDISSLISIATAKEILAIGLDAATALGLAVTSWRTGDPTRTLYVFLSEVLAKREEATAEFIRGGILSLARGAWLKVHAKEVYNVDVQEATHATSTVTLLNTGGGRYEIGPGDLTVKAGSTGKTYHSTSSVTLDGEGSTGAIDVIADEPGSDSSAAANEINEMISSFLGVEVTASTVAVGIDEQDEPSVKEQCRATTGALSPNGPPDAYEYVCRNSELTGTTAITRAASSENSSAGHVIVYVAGPSGAVGSDDVTLAQTAVMRWAKPLCITPTVVSASNAPQTIVATVTGSSLPAGLASDASAAISAYIAALRISTAERPTKLTRSAVISIIQNLAVAAGAYDVSVSLSSPAADVTLAIGRVATVGSVTVG